MPGHFRSPVCPPPKLPAGLLGRDYLKFLQISVDHELHDREPPDEAAVLEAIATIRRSSMRAARPAMKVVFDGSRFWLASHLHRYEAARRLGVRHQEFWCDIVSGSKDEAVRRFFAS
jgi:hypothetical protein